MNVSFGPMADTTSPTSFSVSPITRSETNLDVSVEESGPLCADELGLVRADDFGPTSSDDDVVQEAEELKHVLAPILPSQPKVEPHNVSHLPFRSWCSACVRGVDFHLVIAKSARTRRKQTRYRLSSWTMGSSGNRKTEHRTHFQCSSCESARAKTSGVTQCRRRV